MVKRKLSFEKRNKPFNNPHKVQTAITKSPSGPANTHNLHLNARVVKAEYYTFTRPHIRGFILFTQTVAALVSTYLITIEIRRGVRTASRAAYYCILYHNKALVEVLRCTVPSDLLSTIGVWLTLRFEAPFWGAVNEMKFVFRVIGLRFASLLFTAQFLLLFQATWVPFDIKNKTQVFFKRLCQCLFSGCNLLLNWLTNLVSPSIFLCSAETYQAFW